VLFRAMERVTAAAFGQRRKMLRGALRSLGPAEALLAAAGIAPERRAEELPVAAFDALARAWLAQGGAARQDARGVRSPEAESPEG
jgi:16S rRNA (adenine1518-N6/adenine1519-N6)-dimethyltransferase